jgi:hypothetical protein
VYGACALNASTEVLSKAGNEGSLVGWLSCGRAKVFAKPDMDDKPEGLPIMVL